MCSIVVLGVALLSDDHMYDILESTHCSSLGCHADVNLNKTDYVIIFSRHQYMAKLYRNNICLKKIKTSITKLIQKVKMPLGLRI